MSLRSCLAMVTLAALVGCDAPGPVGARPLLHVPSTSYGMQMENVRPQVPYSFDDVPICLEEPGSVTITDVELANPAGGLRLRRFSVRESPGSGSMSYLEDQRGTLTGAGYPATGPFTVDDLCFDDREEATDEPISLLGFEVERGDGSTDGPAHSTGLVVTYDAAGHQHSAFVGYAVLLCPGQVARRPDCDVHDVRPPD